MDVVELKLPTRDGRWESYRLTGSPIQVAHRSTPRSRVVFAAAHVVADPWQDIDVSAGAAVDWECTLAYRRYLWSLGLGVAEAMDTAQRGMGLDWEASRELIRLSTAEARALGARVACGAGTDHLTTSRNPSLSDIERAYLEQCEFIEQNGGQVILMASRALAASAKGPGDYRRVYDTVLSNMSKPVILHWLGDMFDPHLTGYWGHTDPLRAMDECLEILHRWAHRVDGIKLSLLDSELEIRMRRLLPPNVRMYTGDDFNYPELILGDGTYHSHALLGIFDAIAPVAAEALHALDTGDLNRYRALFHPTVALSRHIFQRPTRFYKTGVVFLAYLNGHQSHFRMVGGMESMRSILHLSDLFRLADRANVLVDPELAVHRMKLTLALAGGQA